MSDARFYVLITFGIFAVSAWTFAKSAPAGFRFLAVAVRRNGIRAEYPHEGRPGKSGACLRLCIGLSLVMLGMAPILAVLAYAGVIGK